MKIVAIAAPGPDVCRTDQCRRFAHWWINNIPMCDEHALQAAQKAGHPYLPPKEESYSQLVYAVLSVLKNKTGCEAL